MAPIIFLTAFLVAFLVAFLTEARWDEIAFMALIIFVTPFLIA